MHRDAESCAKRTHRDQMRRALAGECEIRFVLGPCREVPDGFSADPFVKLSAILCALVQCLFGPRARNPEGVEKLALGSRERLPELVTGQAMCCKHFNVRC